MDEYTFDKSKALITNFRKMVNALPVGTRVHGPAGVINYVSREELFRCLDAMESMVDINIPDKVK